MMLVLEKFNLECDKEKFYNLVLSMTDYFTDYKEKVPSVTEVLEEFVFDLPPNLTMTDKDFFLIYKDKKLCAFADIVYGFPKENFAMLGILVISKDYRNNGLGKKILKRLEGRVLAKKKTYFLLSVLTASDSYIIWQKLGFKNFGELMISDYGEQATLIKEL